MMMTNFRNVLKVFKMMRDFDSDDHALLNTLRNATEADIELLVEAVGPAKKPTKKAATKSRRRTGISDAIKGTAGVAGREVVNGGEPCSYQYPAGSAVNAGLFCREPASDAIHDKSFGYAGYHPFESSSVVITAKDDNYQEQAGAVVGGD